MCKEMTQDYMNKLAVSSAASKSDSTTTIGVPVVPGITTATRRRSTAARKRVHQLFCALNQSHLQAMRTTDVVLRV